MRIRQGAVVLLLCSLFLIPAADAAPDAKACLACHASMKGNIEKEKGVVVRLNVDAEKFSKSVHGSFNCVECHLSQAAQPHKGPAAPVDKAVLDLAKAISVKSKIDPVAQAACINSHPDPYAAYKASVHGQNVMVCGLHRRPFPRRQHRPEIHLSQSALHGWNGDRDLRLHALLFARAGIPHCPICGREVVKQSAQEIVDRVETLPDGTRVLILSPLVRARKGTYQAVFEEVRKAGFARARVDGTVYNLDDEINLDRYKQHTIEAVVDRLVIANNGYKDERKAARTRLTDSIETALKFGEGYVSVNLVDQKEDIHFSEHLACP